MKKFLAGTLAAAMIAGGGTSAFAQDMDDKKAEGTVNYGQMSKHAEQMHPDMTREEIKDMYLEMHGTMGAKPSADFEMGDMHGDMNGDMNGDMEGDMDSGM
ncbi:hypothetical protein [Bacillus marinisedimentorum]|uniref:hypothetical protein n=1 Tax=Bacillus marinisedimentorum TaxID=1821260 RepID=UPI0007E27230|nr:hypothetical protein [Bacillus marinisedimentorum]